jgi:KaiC/GvpD/RAD55 family RecA-like ATPase
MLEKIKSGIPGFDEIMGGGIPKGQVVLISGTCGTGKTTMSAQYIYEGITKYNENGVFLSFEESPESMKATLQEMGMDFAALERQGKFKFIKYDPYHLEEVYDILSSTVTDVKAQRVVIDSLSALALHLHDRADIRKMIFDLSSVLRKLNVTTMVVSEIVPGKTGISRYGIEEFLADSVIVLYYERNKLVFSRGIHVWKSRGSAHSKKLHPYKITSKGVRINPEEEAFMSEERSPG